MKPGVIDYLKVIEDEKELGKYLAPFDEIIADPAGTATKGFAMIKGSSINEIYDIIKNNPDSHFRFCCDDYIHTASKEEFNSMMFSAVIRKSRSDNDFAISELVGSRVCELLTVDAPFVAPIGKSKKIVASVDFLRYSQEMETYAEYTGVMFGRKATASDWARRFKTALDKDTVHNLTEEKKKTLIKDVIKHYLVRRFLLQDNDFNCGNLAIVSGSDLDLSLVSFDFEFCLNNYLMINRSQDLPANFMEQNIKDLAEKFPEELAIAVDEMQITPEKSQAIKNILGRFLDEGYAMYWSYSIVKNANAINNLCKQYCVEKDLVNEQ